MKQLVTLIFGLLCLLTGSLINAQPQVFTNPDKILNIAIQDSASNFGSPLVYSMPVNSIVSSYLNDDEYEDLLVSAPGGTNLQGEIVGNVYIYLGTANGISTTPSQVVSGIRPINIQEPRGGCVVGDFNGDNHNDLLVGYEHYNTQGTVSQGYAICFFGKSDGSGIDTTQKIIFESLGGYANFTNSFNEGDINGDGIDDLIIGAMHDAGFAGRIYIYFGGSSFDATPEVTLLRNGSTILGYYILKSADINNDGYDDIITLDMPGWNECNLTLDVFEGDSSINPEPLFTKVFEGIHYLQTTDINGDGFDDVIGSSTSSLNCNGTAPYQYITLIKGSANYSLENYLLIPFQGQVAMPSNFENSVDVNNDGINDVFLTIKKDDGTKESYIFAGHPTDYINLADTLFKFVDTDNSYGNTIENIIPADCNGDGKPEFYGYSQMAPYKSVIFVYENLPQMEKIFFSAKPTNEDFYSIYSMNINGSNRVQLFSDNYHRRCPIISKDQNKIFYLKRLSVYEIVGDSVWICSSNLDGSNEEIIITNSEPGNFSRRTRFDVSPDNKKILYVSIDGDQRDGDIFEYDTTTHVTLMLTNDWDYLEDDPVYSPVGSKIVYTKNGTPWYADPWPMYRMNADGTGNELFQPNGDGHYSRPEFSPDGAKFTFCYAPGVGMLYSLYVANGDGTAPQQIIPSAGSSSGIYDPTFNPSGTQLAFSSENNSLLVITDLTGNILQQIDTTGINGFFEIEWGVVGGSGLPDPAGPITGPSEVCQGETGVQFSIDPVANATGYVWTLPEGATIVGGENTTTIIVNFSTTVVSGNISVYGTNANGNGDPSPDFFVIVNPLPADIGESTGNLNSLNEGLVAYYPFNGNADDESGNGNNGINYGGVPALDRKGIVNGALYFNGFDNWVEVANSPSISSPENGITVSAWMRSENDYAPILCKINGPSYNAFQYRTGYVFGNGNFGLGINGVDFVSYSSIFPLLSEWLMFTITYDANSIDLYINSVLSQSIPCSEMIIPNSERLEIARDAHGPIEWFKGVIDDLRIYNRPLTAEEITCLYTGNCTGGILSAEVLNNSICENESTSIEIINSQPGISYQLIKDQVNYGEPQVGNGDTLVFPISGLVQTSNFDILATDTATGCFITLDTTLVVNVFAINAVVSADTAICTGSPVTLSASGGDAYLWSNGMTSAEITVTPEITTTYSVTISNNFGCSETHDILVTVHPLPLDIGQSTGTGNTINEGLVAYYPFNGNANDESGNGNHGVVNGATLTEDRFGNENSAYEFNGFDDFISFANKYIFHEQTDASLSLWIFHQGGEGQRTIIFSRSDEADQDRFHYFTNHVGNFEELNYDYREANSILHPFSGTFLSQQEWIHIVFSRSNNSYSIYKNGQYINELVDTYSNLPTTTGWKLAGKNAYGYRFKGKLDDILIYNRALTAEEVAALYSGGSTSGDLAVEVANYTICKGSSSSINILNSQTGIEYQLYQDGSAFGTTLTGDGSTLTFPVNDLSVTSTFQIQATDPVTDCMIVLDTTLTVTVVNVTAKANAYTTSEFVPTTINCSSQSEGAVTWEWYADGVFFSSQPQPQLLIEEPGEHEIVLLVTSGPPANCSDSDTVIIIIQEIIHCEILIPSSFTPNNDGINDYFKILTDGASSADVWMKDPWGILVKQFDGINEKWDGQTQAGKEAPAGAYYCIVEAVDKAGGTHEKQGVVYLFRDMVDVNPNPASKSIIVETNGRIPGEREVKIYSAMGETMLELKTAADKFEIDISPWPSGIYFLQIANDLDQLTTRFIKN